MRRIWRSLLAGVEGALATGWRGWLALACGLLLGWWLYVPLHELAHAFGCLATGGEVSRLELAPEYGAVLLARWLPFVAVGSDYAGQLTGFDTRGSDTIYLATVLAPYLFTLFPGVPTLLVSAGRTGARGSFSFGASLPWALAPLLSLPGDYYEAGSILASRAETLWAGGEIPLHWRSDDLFRLLEEQTRQGTLEAGTAMGIGAGLLIGTVLAVATLWLALAMTRGVSRLTLGHAQSGN